MAVNKARGEVEVIIDGEPRRLCLTLGALAEIESALGVTSMKQLGAELSDMCAEDMLKVLECLLKGGGTPMAYQDLAAADIHPTQAARAIAATFGASHEEGRDALGKPKATGAV